MTEHISSIVAGMETQNDARYKWHGRKREIVDDIHWSIGEQKNVEGREMIEV